MTLFSVLALICAILALAITPNPRVHTTILAAKNNGFSSTLFLVLGIVLGDTVLLFMAIFFLEAIMFFLLDFYIFFKYLGGLYLLYLAYRLLISKSKDKILRKSIEKSWQKNFLFGLFLGVSSYKMLLFYIGFFPAFTNIESFFLKDIVISVLVATLTLSIVLLFYTYKLSDTKNLFKFKIFKKKKKLKKNDRDDDDTPTSVVIRA